MLSCYLCKKLIRRHEYTRHVASHPPSDFMPMDPQPEYTLPAFSNDSSNYDHPNSPDAAFPVPSDPPRSRARNLREYADDHRQDLPEAQSGPLNAFQIWYRDHAHSSPKYTTIDGGKSEPDSEVRQGAKILRGTTKEEIVKTVKNFKGFSNSDERRTCLELVQKVPIFPGLVAYTYTHLIMCSNRGWLGLVYKDDWSDHISKLKLSVEVWAKYEGAWCILSFNAIMDVLLKILRATKVGPEEHKCNSSLLDGTMVVKHDILNLVALVVLCITGEEKKDILGKPGGQVERLIELFHELLESNVGLDECYRRCILNVLIPFSKESGCCPRGFYIPEHAVSDLQQKTGGAFGQVFKGKLDSRLVAVKALKRSGRRNNTMTLPDYTKLLSEEAIVWWYLRHPNCLPLYGIYGIPKEGQNMLFGLVSPWMDQGTLSDYLKRKPSANRTKLILDVVRGLNYLHTREPHVAHRDIKPDNILITNNGHACLADFGLASVFDKIDDLHPAASEVPMGGTPNYMAPEIFCAMSREAKCQVNKRACDMYALGCTIYEIYTNRAPLAGVSPATYSTNLLADRISPDMWSFVKNLCDIKPLKRLTAVMALDWMELKASEEGIDPSLAPLGEAEWDSWERTRDTDNLWSVW